MGFLSENFNEVFDIVYGIQALISIAKLLLYQISQDDMLSYSFHDYCYNRIGCFYKVISVFLRHVKYLLAKILSAPIDMIFI